MCIVRRWRSAEYAVLPGHGVYYQLDLSIVWNVVILPRQDSFTGRTMHSTSYKTAKDHVDKKVVIIGSCCSGQENMLCLLVFPD